MDNKSKLDLKRQVFDQEKFQSTVDTKFSQLISQGVDGFFDINLATQEDFFNLYTLLFEEIPKNGDYASHEYLIKTSNDYVNLSLINAEIEALLDEIEELREQNLQLQIDNNTLSNQNILLSQSNSRNLNKIEELKEKIRDLQTKILELEGQISSAVEIDRLNQVIYDLQDQLDNCGVGGGSTNELFLTQIGFNPLNIDGKQSVNFSRSFDIIANSLSPIVDNFLIDRQGLLNVNKTSKYKLELKFDIEPNNSAVPLFNQNEGLKIKVMKGSSVYREWDPLFTSTDTSETLVFESTLTEGDKYIILVEAFSKRFGTMFFLNFTLNTSLKIYEIT